MTEDDKPSKDLDIQSISTSQSEAPKSPSHPKSLNDMFLPGDESARFAYKGMQEPRASHESISAAKNRFGSFKIIQVLAQSDRTTIFQARNIIERDVVIKMLNLEQSGNPIQAEKFRQEAKALSKLSHPGFPEMFAFGVAPTSELFITMELLKGRTITDLLKAKERFDVTRAVEIIVAAADAMEHAHKQGVIHCELTPDHIMLCSDGHTEVVKVIDFGSAHISDVDATTNELSEEVRCDISFLALSAYAMMIPDPALLSFETEPGPGFAVSRQLFKVLKKAATAEPEASYQSMWEFKAALLSAL